MAIETEAKFEVTDFRGVRNALRRAGATYRGTAVEEDVFFDTPERRLYHKGCGLRLRRVKMLRSVPGGRRSGWLLTSKGQVERSNRVKKRQETQTWVADGQAVKGILALAGMFEFVGLTKRRASYKLGRCLIELDEVPSLGFFVEIEGPTQKAIEAARKKLQLPDEPITESYLSMVADTLAR